MPLIPLYLGTPVQDAAEASALAHMEWCLPWEPSIAPDVTGQANQQQNLWGHPGVLWDTLAEQIDNATLAHMEWCLVWEPALPVNPGTFGQDDQQQLLWGYPGVLWSELVADESGTRRQRALSAFTRRRKRKC